MKIGKNNSLSELLNENDNLELKKWLISNGKSRKSYCPVMFNEDDNNEELEENECLKTQSMD